MPYFTTSSGRRAENLPPVRPHPAARRRQYRQGKSEDEVRRPAPELGDLAGPDVRAVESPVDRRDDEVDVDHLAEETDSRSQEDEHRPAPQSESGRGGPEDDSPEEGRSELM